MNLEVRGCEVYMYVHTETNEGHWEETRAYPYDIRRHNAGPSELSPLGSSNDVFFLLAVAPYTWSWNDGIIKRVGRKNGKVEEFARSEAAQ